MGCCFFEIILFVSFELCTKMNYPTFKLYRSSLLNTSPDDMKNRIIDITSLVPDETA